MSHDERISRVEGGVAAPTRAHRASMRNRSSEPSAELLPARADDSTSSRPREQFIPIRRAELIELLAGIGSLSGVDERRFRQLCEGLHAIFHREYQAVLDELKECYAPFDPDSDTKSHQAPGPNQDSDRQARLFERFGWLLARGNFIRIKQEEIEQALEEHSHWGLALKVDFAIFDRLELFYRGDRIGTRFRRRLLTGFRTEAVELPVYERLVLMFRFRRGRQFSKVLDTDDVHVKLFKDIPKLDVDMLLPGTQVQMSLVDRAKIMFPTLSGLSLAATKLVLAWGSGLAMWGLVGGTLGYGTRSVFGYMNTKQKYQLNLTERLYYQNIDNNAGVIHRMIDEAEEQENREAILAYYFLWQRGVEGYTTEALDQQVERFLEPLAGREVDFEIGDALEKLERLGLIDRIANQKWKAVAIDQALERSALHWSGLLAAREIG
ncbi:MAG TPA: TMEM143 family protein [Pirellulales bacterium]